MGKWLANRLPAPCLQPALNISGAAAHRTSAWERFDAAISRAAENPAVVALIKARGGPLKEALADCTASQRSDLSSPHEWHRPGSLTPF
jgi:hypothetical protein